MKYINSLYELDDFIIDNHDNLILLYFGATWCEPCAKLKKRLDSDEINQTMPNIVVCYINIDIESNAEICEHYNITILPTQIFIKLNDETVNVLNRVDGYDWIKLVMLYNENISSYNN